MKEAREYMKIGWKYRKIIPYVTIDGWLSSKEAICLYEISSNPPNKNPRIVEIGSWLGKSSFILAKGIESKSFPRLYCIDPFNADGENTAKRIYEEKASHLELSLEECFIKNMKKLGVYPLIKILTGYSFDFSRKWEEQIDFLFIDGNHEYEAVLLDYKEWSKFIKPGGWIAFHDYVPEGNPRGLRMVIQEYIKDNPKFKKLKIVDSLCVAQKDKIRGCY